MSPVVLLILGVFGVFLNRDMLDLGMLRLPGYNIWTFRALYCWLILYDCAYFTCMAIWV